MNQQQERNLQALVRNLRALSRGEVKQFDMLDPCFCAWGRAERFLWCGFGSKADLDLATEKNFGLRDDVDYGAEEIDYLFQNDFGLTHPYDTPTGRAGIEEFADRAENVIQYYRSIREAA